MEFEGKVREWEESSFDLFRSGDSSSCGIRGGHWDNAFCDRLSSSFRLNFIPGNAQKLSKHAAVLDIRQWNLIKIPSLKTTFRLGSLARSTAENFAQAKSLGGSIWLDFKHDGLAQQWGRMVDAG